MSDTNIRIPTEPASLAEVATARGLLTRAYLARPPRGGAPPAQCVRAVLNEWSGYDLVEAESEALDGELDR